MRSFSSFELLAFLFYFDKIDNFDNELHGANKVRCFCAFLLIFAQNVVCALQPEKKRKNALKIEI